MKRKGLSQAERRAVEEFVSRLRDRFPHEVEAIKLYGSKARGTSRPDSDIDILVVVKGRFSAVNEAIIDLVCDMLNEYGVYIETVTMSSKDYEKAVRYEYPFAINVEREAIRL